MGRCDHRRRSDFKPFRLQPGVTVSGAQNSSPALATRGTRRFGCRQVAPHGPGQARRPPRRWSRTHPCRPAQFRRTRCRSRRVHPVSGHPPPVGAAMQLESDPARRFLGEPKRQLLARCRDSRLDNHEIGAHLGLRWGRVGHAPVRCDQRTVLGLCHSSGQRILPVLSMTRAAADEMRTASSLMAMSVPLSTIQAALRRSTPGLSYVVVATTAWSSVPATTSGPCETASSIAANMRSCRSGSHDSRSWQSPGTPVRRSDPSPLGPARVAAAPQPAASTAVSTTRAVHVRRSMCEGLPASHCGTTQIHGRFPQRLAGRRLQQQQQREPYRSRYLRRKTAIGVQPTSDGVRGGRIHAVPWTPATG